jgi:FimV-like protein
MITLLIKAYLSILLTVGIGALLLLTAGIFFIVKFFQPKASVHSSPKIDAPINLTYHPQSKDIAAISGEDPIATQLDLARAYLEAGKSTLAQKILANVAKQGSSAQQNEARSLQK